MSDQHHRRPVVKPSRVRERRAGAFRDNPVTDAADRDAARADGWKVIDRQRPDGKAFGWERPVGCGWHPAYAGFGGRSPGVWLQVHRGELGGFQWTVTGINAWNRLPGVADPADARRAARVALAALLRQLATLADPAGATDSPTRLPE